MLGRMPTAAKTNARALLKSLAANVLALTKDNQPPDYGGQPGTPPVPATAGVTSKGVMMDVHQRLGSALEKVGEDGSLPGDVSSELRALAGLLITIAGEESAEEAGEGDAGSAAAEPSEQKRLLVKFARQILKAELDPYTAMYATVQAARDKTYDVMSLFTKDPAAAAAGLKEVASMLENAANMVSGGNPAPTETTAAMPQETKRMTKRSFTPAAFVAWAGAQIAKASTEPVTAANKRLAAVAKAVAVYKEAVGTYPDNAFTGETQKLTGIDIEIEEAYAGSAEGNGIGNATQQDLTSLEEQETEEPGEQVSSRDASFFENLGDIASVQSGGNNGGTNLPSSNASQDTAFAANFSKTGAQQLGKMIADLKVIGAVAKKASTQVAKRARIAEQNPWPRDLNTEEFMEPEKLAKRDADAKARAERDSWGSDPWAR